MNTTSSASLHAANFALATAFGRSVAGIAGGCLLLCGAALPAGEPVLQAVSLGDLDPSSARQGWGELAIDQSVQGKPLQIGDRHFARGLGTHANSEIVYDLDGAWERFEAWVGVDAEMAQYREPSVVFKVLGDGRELFKSGRMRIDTPARRVSVPLAGIAQLKLVVTDAGDGINCDHADWAEAVLLGKPRPPEPLPPLPPPSAAKYRMRTRGLAIALSDQGELVEAILGGHRLQVALQGGTALAGCTNNGAVASRKLRGGGVEFTRSLTHRASGRQAVLVERFTPTRDSVRWEIEIRSEGSPWSTGIETWLRWPDTNSVRFWTAWDDPERKPGAWQDPLVLRPLANARRWYGASHWNEEAPQIGAPVGNGNRFFIPLLTLAAPGSDSGLSLVLSPEDPLLEVSLSTRTLGLVKFTRSDYRLSKTNVVRFAMDLVGHPADWRGGLEWMVRRYPDFFHPPNPRADLVEGLGAYSNWEGDLDVAKLHRMDFRVNWKASYDFPYMGMFLPPIPDQDRYPRFLKGNQTSIAQLRDYSMRMKQMGFEVLNYFNVTEFGGLPGNPKAADPNLAPKDHWKNLHNFLGEDVPDGQLLDLEGRPYLTWGDAVAMDPGGARYRAFLLDQARRHVASLPDSAGICIDRTDWLRYYNFRADDGLSWRHSQPCRALYVSWEELLAQLGPVFHQAGKVIFINALINRTELLRHVDGIYHEFGHIGGELNGAALQCVFKPCLAWTPDENTLRPDPDAYFQRHLYLGVFPTAPLPDNDHTINPSPWAERWYLDYGPLFRTLHGRKWVLRPHAVEVEAGAAKANLFEVPGGYVVPVVFGGPAPRAEVIVRGLDRHSRLSGCDAFYPGAQECAAISGRIRNGELHLTVALQRGCAVVRIHCRKPGSAGGAGRYGADQPEKSGGNGPLPPILSLSAP